MQSILSTVDLDDTSLLGKVRVSPGLVGRDLVQEVMPKDTCTWNMSLSELGRPSDFVSGVDRSDGPHVVAIDYGMKWNISRLPAGYRLSCHDCSGHSHSHRNSGIKPGWRVSVERARRSGAVDLRD